MKKLLTKIKTVLATLWITLISFFSKVTGQNSWEVHKIYEKFNDLPAQPMYWVETYYEPSPLVPILNTIQRLTGIAIFIIWIVNLIRIIKTNDKDLKKKRIKNTIIIISILIILIIISLLLPRFLKKYL